MPITRIHVLSAVLFLILSFLLSANSSFAETKTFVREYTYQASEFDSKASCRTLALEQVKRLLLEEIGTYLESLTEVNNFQLTKDQIIVITAGIVGVQVVNEKWDGKSYYLLAKITANPDDVAKSIDSLRKDRQKIKELEEAKKKSDDLFKEVENLREELKASTNKKTKAFRLKQTEYENMINSVNAIEWFNLGVLSDEQLFRDGASDQYLANRKAAMERKLFAFNKAISLNPNYAEAYLERGYVYHFMDLYQEALRDLNKAIELNRQLVGAYKWRAGTYAKLGNYDQMMKDYDQAMAITPKDIYLYLFRAWDCQRKEFGVAGLDQAVKDYTKLIEIEPLAAHYYSSRASVYKQKADYELAIRDYNKIIELQPKTWSHYKSRGELFAELKKYQQALDDYTTAINSSTQKSNNELTDLYLARVESYENIGDKQHAEQDLIAAIKLNPIASRAWLLFKHGRYADAIQASSEDSALTMRILHQNPDNQLFGGYFVRAICYYQMKNYNKALSECTDGVQKNPGDVKLRAFFYCLRSTIYRNMGDYKNALSDLNQAIKINPDPDIYIMRGIYYLKRDEYQSALNDFEKVSALDPKKWRESIQSSLKECKNIGKNNKREILDIFYEGYNDIPNKFEILQKKYPQFQKKFVQIDKIGEPTISKEKEWLVIGKAFFESKNYERAIDAFSKAIKIAPTYIDVYFERGSAYEKLKKYREAIKDYDRFIALNPEVSLTVLAYSNRGSVHHELKNYQKAIQDFDAAIELCLRSGPRDVLAELGLDSNAVTSSPCDKAFMLYRERGKLYLDLGNYQQSIKDYSSAIDLNKGNKYVYYNRGLGYFNMEKNIQAIEDVNRAIEIDSKFESAYILRGIIYGTMKSYQNAIIDFDKVIELNPQLAEAYYNKGVLYGKIGNNKLAIENIKIAARLGHKDAQKNLKSNSIEW